jgi:hypothetical protein
VGDVHWGDVVHGDQVKQYGSGNTGIVKHAGEPRPAPQRRRETILMLTANPWGTVPLRLDEELRAVRAAIVSARNRDQIDVRAVTAVRYTDLHAAFLGHAPIVAHFSGHGSRSGGIVLGDERGAPFVVAPRALTDLFRIVGRSIRCVVLNACLTRDQATAIAQHIPCVVGMSREVPDDVAIEFATAFYYAVADGQSVGTAFELGCNRIDLRGRGGATTPVLMAAHEVARRVFITG